MSQKGVIHLLPLLILAVVLLGAVLFATGKLKTPSILKKQPTVELKTEYKNPFKQETQYVNPFETYKNPFTVGR